MDPKRRWIGRVVAATVACTAISAAVGTTGASAYKVPCDTGFEQSFVEAFAEAFTGLKPGSCGEFVVPRDHSGGDAGRMVLRFKRYAPKGKTKGTLLFLAGGPGQPSVELGADIPLRQAAPGYRVIEYNQRGTGETALRCPRLEQISTNAFAVSPASIETAFSDCATTIGPTRTMFSSIDSARDIEVLRQELGADKLTIVGVSYGTYVAQLYARLFPNRVEKLVLDSVVGAEGVDPLARSTFAATRRLIDQQCKNGACGGVTNNFTRDVEQLQARIRSGPVRGTYVDRKGKPRNGSYGGSTTLGDLYAAGDFNPLIREALPAAVKAALAGDTSPLLRLQLSTGEGPFSRPTSFSMALFAATVCGDTRLPWQAAQGTADRRHAWEQALGATPAGDFAPLGVEAAAGSFEAAGCLAWPETSSALTPALPLPDVPALLLAGEQDVRTPVEDARQVAKLFPRAELVTVPEAGHSLLGTYRCADLAMRRFMRDRPIAKCKREPDWLPTGLAAGAIPRSISQFRPTGGAQGRAGQAAGALVATLQDAQASMLLSAGSQRFRALRRGYGEIGDFTGRIKLKRYSYVPGLEVTGVISRRETVLRLRGSRSSSGVLVRKKKRLVGTIGGRRVSLSRDVLPYLTFEMLSG